MIKVIATPTTREQIDEMLQVLGTYIKLAVDVRLGILAGGGVLHADHIKPFAFFPSLRFDLENGRTLCVECHKKTPTFGGRCKKLDYVKL